MYDIREIDYFSDEYQMTLELRNEVMRKPIGLNIYEQDFTHEQQSFILGAFYNGELHGVGVLGQQGTEFTVEYLCVDTKVQSKGLGGILLQKLEQVAREKQGTKIGMDARVSAAEFYKKHGYSEFGEVFLMEVAPVDHIRMEKKL